MIKQLLLIAVLLLAQNAHADQRQDLSPSVVLVLKLVSTTRVRPTTGIVISETGLVLVSADFVGTDDQNTDSEILVLDGGTDIIKHGRPAVVFKRSMTGGLAVLKVSGLERPGITLSEDVRHQKNDVHFEAFPPAEYIAKGAEPLWIAASSKQRLPYVSGPIIDTCGYLAGMSLTRGSQSMDTSTAPGIMPAADIKRVLDSMQLSMPGASCGAVLEQTAIAEGVQDDGIAEPSDEIGEIGSPTNQAPDTSGPKMNVRSSGNPFSPASANPVARTIARPSLWRSVPWWLQALGFIILAATARKVFLFYRLHKNSKNQLSPVSIEKIQSTSVEPDTALLGTGSETPSTKPRSAQVEELEIPDVNTLPAGFNGIVVLEGLIDANRIIKRFSMVNTDHAEAVIGRGDVDISIEHPAISRLHALIRLEKGVMTLSDTDSHNGTYINGIPCLPGEIMFVESEDEIFLGSIRVRISLVTRETVLYE